MGQTEIYTSLKEFHKYENTIFEVLKEYCINLYQYKSSWNGNIEEGFKLEFTKKLTKQDIKIIFERLKTIFGINCFYLKHGSFNGCVLEYLGFKGCI